MTRFHASLVLLGLCSAAAPTPAGDGLPANWPRFRGPGGNGVAAASAAPIDCDLKAGTHVAWIAQVPAAGFSSPVVWGDRVFLSGGDDAACSVMGFDAGSGRLLWQTAVPRQDGAGRVKTPDQGGMASSTVATDGRRVYAMFANGDLAACDPGGRLVWVKRLGTPKNPYGHAASLLTWNGRVVVQFDQGEADDRLSRILAFEGATGDVAWEKPRPVGASWATPITIEAAGRAQIVTLAAPWVIAYDARDGTEIWRADCLDGEVTPSPVFANGTVFAVHPASKLQTLRPDGTGDVSATHLGWIAEDGIPDIASPVSDGRLVFLVDSGGTVTCYDAAEGRKQWTHDLEEECNASPSLAAGRLHILTRKGTWIVLEAGREFRELARSTLGEPVFASPAFAGDRMFVRGTKHLFCIGPRKGDAVPPGKAGTASP